MRPRIRTVKPEAWDDERISRLSRDSRLLFVGLVTIADDEGRFRARQSTIVGAVFPDDTDAPRNLRKWIAEIKDSGMVVFYIDRETPYGAFKNWAKHQKINRPSPSELPPPPDPKVTFDNGLVETDKGFRQRTKTERDRGPIQGAFSECDVNESLNAHGGLNPPPRERGSAPDPDPILLLCRQLADRVCANDAKASVNPDGERWRNDMRLLVDDRGGNDAAVEEVRKMIDWSQSHHFWRANILSPGKLRAQFTQLVLRASEAGQPSKGRDAERQRVADLDAKRLAAAKRLMGEKGIAS